MVPKCHIAADGQLPAQITQARSRAGAGGAGTVTIDVQGHPWTFWFGRSGVDPAVCILNKHLPIIKI